MDWSLLWKEVLDWRKYFTVRGCLTPLILGFAPSLWDVLSDYDYAATWPEETKDKPRDPRVMPRGYLYLFICLPVTMLVLSQLSREAEGSLNKICCNCCSGCCCRVLKYILIPQVCDDNWPPVCGNVHCLLPSKLAKVLILCLCYCSPQLEVHGSVGPRANDEKTGNLGNVIRVNL